MALNNLTLLVGGTCSATGGVSKTYTPDGQTVTNGLHVADATEADLRIRPHVQFRTQIPKFDANTGKYLGKEKRFFNLTRPKLEADGSISNNYIKIEVGYSPSSTAAEKAELYTSGAQLCFDTDTVDFRTAGSLA
jgi:hypothetical protein